METNESFEMLGVTIDYHANSSGSHETVTFDGFVVVDQCGQVGPWHGSEWSQLLSLSGAAMESKRVKFIKDHVEYLLREAMVSSLPGW